MAAPQLEKPERQRTTLAARPLSETLADKSRTAFTTTSSDAPKRSVALIKFWEYTWTTLKYDHIKDMFAFMFEKRPEFSSDDKWLPVRPLGNGSFGAAALFRHVNGQGDTDDHVVAKCASDKEPGARVKDNIENISMEASIMIQLNELPENESILFLRNFRHYSDYHYWLYLTEHCPSMNLETLRLTYKAMRRTLPEAFLWYIFYGLAKGLINMERGPFGEYLDPKKVRKDAYLVHRDIKPDNIFLGYAPTEEHHDSVWDYDAIALMGDVLEYPHVKVADFGLSEIFTNGDRDNTMAKQRNIGTPLWHAPEMRLDSLQAVHRFMVNRFYPFARTCFDAQGRIRSPTSVNDSESHAYTPAGNTFVTGILVYQLMTLDEPEGMDYLIDRILSRKENEPYGTLLDIGSIIYRENHIRGYPNEAAIIAAIGAQEWKEQKAILSMLRNWRDAPYSPELKGYVERCLMLRPEDRIKVDVLRNNTELLMKQYLNARLQHLGYSETFERETEVFTKEEDLDKMPCGTANFDRDESFWNLLLNYYKWLDLGAGCIEPDLTEPDVSAEAKAFFSPGRRQTRNQALLKRNANAVATAQPHIAILNPSKRRKGSAGNVLKLKPSGNVQQNAKAVTPPVANIVLSNKTKANMQKVYRHTQANLAALHAQQAQLLTPAEQAERITDLQQRLLKRGHNLDRHSCRGWLKYYNYDVHRTWVRYVWSNALPEVTQLAAEQQAQEILDTYQRNHGGDLPCPVDQLQTWLEELKLQVALKWNVIT